MLGWLFVRRQQPPKEADKIFHAGPAESGLGVIYFGLYKDGRYQFCAGTFMDPGCYTGPFALSGDTMTLLELHKHEGLRTNRFLIRRYASADSTYWKWKTPVANGSGYSIDTIPGATGDIWPLDSAGHPIHQGQNYWVIRYDRLQH